MRSLSRQFLTAESPLKMMKNAFHFMLKALFIFEIFIFLSDFLVMLKSHLIRKLISKFMTSQTGQQIITIHILLNISKRQSGNEIWLVNRI